MLSKEVCKKCINQSVFLNWSSTEDEIDWEDFKTVYCPVSIDKSTRVTDPPPEWCQKTLEHALAGVEDA